MKITEQQVNELCRRLDLLANSINAMKGFAGGRGYRIQLTNAQFFIQQAQDELLLEFEGRERDEE